MSVQSPPHRELGAEHSPLEASPTYRPDLSAGRLTSLSGLALLAAGVAHDSPSLVLLGLVASTTAILLRRLPFDIATPVAVVSLLAVAIIAGVGADLLGVNLLALPWLLTGLYCCYAVAAALVAFARPAFGHASPLAGGALLALVPAAVAAITGLLQVASLDIAASWAFIGTDLAHHMTNVSQLQKSGALDYGASSYPQGLHMLAALVSVPSAPLDDARALLDYDLTLMASLTWFALALMLWSAGALTVRLGRTFPVPGWLPVAAAVLLGTSALLTNTFVVFFVLMGAAPSLVAVTVMWLVPLVVLSDVRLASRWPVLLLTTCGSTLVLAHLWQALAIVPACAIGVLFARRLVRLVRSRPRWPSAAGRRDLRWCLPLSAAAIALAALPIVRVQAAGGTAIAATPGDLPPGPWLLFVLALGSVGLLVVRGRRPAELLMLGSVVGLLFAIAVLLSGAGHGLDLGQYYPTKATWFLTLFLSPTLSLVAAAGVRAVALPVWRFLGRVGQAADVLRATTAAVVVALAFALWLPWLLGTEAQSTTAWHPAESAAVTGPGVKPLWSRQAHDIAMRYGGAYGNAIVVPYYVGYSAIFDKYTTRMVSELLSFQTGQPEVAGEAGDICARIREVAGIAPAVVISKLPVRQVQAQMFTHGCAGAARVVHVPGVIKDVIPLAPVAKLSVQGA